MGIDKSAVSEIENKDISPATVSAESMDTALLNDSYHYTGGDDGATPDARLTSVLSDADTGDTIYLEPLEYSANRTLTSRLTFVGTGAGGGGTMGRFTGSLTLDDRISFNFVEFPSGAMIISGLLCQLTNSLMGPNYSITISQNDFRYLNNFGGDLTFTSGTTNGIVDGCRNTTITDNGTNTIGDIA